MGREESVLKMVRLVGVSVRDALEGLDDWYFEHGDVVGYTFGKCLSDYMGLEDMFMGVLEGREQLQDFREDEEYKKLDVEQYGQVEELGGYLEVIYDGVQGVRVLARECGLDFGDSIIEVFVEEISVGVTEVTMW